MTAPTIKTHEADDSASLGEFCGICRRQISRYTCPSCNLFYCSLSCFRSERHSQCSEVFYRKEIETGIKSSSSSTESDRRGMLELLKRIQDENAADEVGLFHPDEECEEDDFARRFSTLDIPSASIGDILQLLNEEERDKFFTALRNPSSGLVQELLRSAELEKAVQLPWWEAPRDGDLAPNSPRMPYGTKPELMVVPVELIKFRDVSLLYNICVVILAYVYVTRHLSMSPLSLATNDPQDRQEARRLLLQTVPFLLDRKSKTLYTSLTGAMISFWSLLKPGSVDKKAMLALLEDVAKLVRPRRIIASLSSEEQTKTGTLSMDHPSSSMTMVISDMHALFSTNPDSSAVAHRRSHVVMKLTFYAAHILAAPPSRLRALADEVHLLSKSLDTGA